jgi:hypothetical protein
LRFPFRRLAASIALLALVSYAAFAQGTGAPPARTSPPIAIVGSRPISRAEFEARTQAMIENYRQRTGTEIPEEFRTLFRREVLESLIRTQLMVLEAQHRHVTVTAAEAEEILKRDPFFNPGGRFDAAKFAAVKSANTPAWQGAMAELRLQVAGQKLQRQIEQEHVPSNDQLRLLAIRALGRVSVDYLDVDAREFDGRIREPRESDVLAYYRDHAAEYREPERAELTVIFVDRPTLPEAERAIPGRLKAWDERLKARADSALAAMRSGATFDQIASAFGGAHTRVVVLPGNFPGYWQGTREQSAAVFQQTPGHALPEAIHSNPGWLIVRVDSRTPAHLAPLAEVSTQIRGLLRGDAREHGEDRELMAIYTQVADSLRGPAVKVRYATADTAAIDPGDPGAAELDRYYRGHLADYSSFDSRTGSIQSLPLAEVERDVRLRWRHDRRAEMAQTLAEGLERAWSQGRRDGALERSTTSLRDAGPLPIGATVDTGLAAAIVSDSIAAIGPVRRTDLVPYARGFLVYQIYDVQPQYRPSFDQARNALRSIQDRRHEREDLAAAHAWFDRNPRAWASGNTENFSRFFITPRDPVNVNLTRAEVLQYYRDHMNDYSAPEVVRARHILISPTGPGAAADRVARDRADSLLTALKEGADFQKMARAVSDDPATRVQGGDLGTFGRGVMLSEFEHAAFALKPGELSGLVHTREGWHIIYCIDHLPLVAQPLAWVYGNVGYDAAQIKADSLAAALADSVYRHIHSPAEARAAAKKLGITVETNYHEMGNMTATPDVKPYLIRLETVKPGQLYPGPHLIKGMGYAITWVDSISGRIEPRWDQAQVRVLERYRQGASMRAVYAKLAEIDSMRAAGWSLDSVGTLWGGLVHREDVPVATGFSDLLGSRATFDSLAYGARGGRPLAIGETSGWCEVPGHVIRVRLRNRNDPQPNVVAQRMESDRRAAMDRALRPVFDEMQHRYRVQILDSDLRGVPLPAPPPAPSGLP